MSVDYNTIESRLNPIPDYFMERYISTWKHLLSEEGYTYYIPRAAFELDNQIEQNKERLAQGLKIQIRNSVRTTYKTVSPYRGMGILSVEKKKTGLINSQYMFEGLDELRLDLLRNPYNAVYVNEDIKSAISVKVNDKVVIDDQRIFLSYPLADHPNNSLLCNGNDYLEFMNIIGDQDIIKVNVKMDLAHRVPSSILKAEGYCNQRYYFKKCHYLRFVEIMSTIVSVALPAGTVIRDLQREKFLADYEEYMSSFKYNETEDILLQKLKAERSFVILNKDWFDKHPFRKFNDLAAYFENAIITQEQNIPLLQKDINIIKVNNG